METKSLQNNSDGDEEEDIGFFGLVDAIIQFRKEDEEKRKKMKKKERIQKSGRKYIQDVDLLMNKEKNG